MVAAFSRHLSSLQVFISTPDWLTAAFVVIGQILLARFWFRDSYSEKYSS